MKAILVPTDFSLAAENAAVYAVHLAEAIRADILLCHAIKIPSEEAVIADEYRPLDDYISVRKKADSDLEILIRKLRQERNHHFSYEPYHPAVHHRVEIGGVTDALRNVVLAEKLPFAVMGMSGEGGLNRLFLGSNARSVIDRAEFPVLLIPSDCTYKPVKKIAFATNLNKSDLPLLQWLVNIVSPLGTEIILTHITAEKYDKGKHQRQVDDFLNQVLSDISYNKVNYREVKSIDVSHGLEWMVEHGHIDLLAIAHQKPGFFTNIFESSHTQRVAKHIHLPLLVFPGPDRPMTVPLF
ncbi:universal stress protein [Mucilaginibacter sp. RS28]|uniref:Universal stress protein n=1 Tax=Mucilaginibacter straminoryzae TaxID=2932774 RepID=A0A9X2B7I0_9SPHI|nr:universal stress protein [Mucilaginibacter straminoryzae]MCJ8208351.1 universal stress protein [Mucilaginibacter straminoryzae]